MDHSGILIGMKRAFWLLPLFLLAACAHKRPMLRSGAAPVMGGVDCEPLSGLHRQRILEVADPTNFPRTRYRRGPSSARGIEKETDCSRFVHEVYRRAGLPFPFHPTASMSDVREFDILPEKEALPGDLMLFRGHVGIVDEQGKIISALRTRNRRRRTSIASIDRKNFRSFRGARYVLRYRCAPPQESLTSEANP